MSEGRQFIIDACALIDYYNADFSVIAKISRHIVPVNVAYDTLANVKQVTPHEAGEAHLQIIAPPLEVYDQATKRIRGLAFDDRVTLLLAVRNKWRCITNDRRLRQACESEGVEVFWGLEPLKLLVGGRHMSTAEAITLARGVQRSNPKYVTQEIILRFESQLRKICEPERF